MFILLFTEQLSLPHILMGKFSFNLIQLFLLIERKFDIIGTDKTVFHMVSFFQFQYTNIKKGIKFCDIIFQTSEFLKDIKINCNKQNAY